MDKLPLTVVLLDHDFRLSDHEGFHAEDESAILALYIIPEEHIHRTSSGNQREALWQSIQELYPQLQALQIAFTVEVGEPLTVLTTLAVKYQINAIRFYRSSRWNESFIQRMKQAFPLLSMHMVHHPTLWHPSDLPFAIKDLPATYTHFRIQVEHHVSIRPPLPLPKKRQRIITIDPHFERLASLRDQHVKLVQPIGEMSAKHHVQNYFFVHQRASTYKKTRNGMLHFEDSTRFSPYLAWGNITARTIYQTLKTYEASLGANASTYWIWFELLWRDYFYFLLHQHITPTPLMDWNHPTFGAWINGQTGFPLVDASMRELRKTGWMSNRGRQNVASFFVHGLKLPWSWGEHYFRLHLLDYDATSNLGNWQYLAGIGADPRENRVFNVTLQFKKYDPNGAYVKTWCPELQGIPTPLLYEPWTMNAMEEALYQCQIGRDYPSPIITDRRFIFSDKS